MDKADPQASAQYRRNPGGLRGRSPTEIERELDQKLVAEGGWLKLRSADGNGVRYLDGKGGSVLINKGYQDGLRDSDGDLLHRGPYVKIQPGRIRVPLAGNPVLK